MSLLDDFARVTPALRCPICGAPKWCLVARDDSPYRGSVICTRVESHRRFGEAGWFHGRGPPRGGASGPRRVVINVSSSTLTEPKLDIAFHIAVSRKNLELHPKLLDQTARDLGVRANSLLSLDMGWSPIYRVAAFPMYDAFGQPVGIRYRTKGGKKFSHRGGHEGLFMSRNLADDPLLFLEGPTDTAAAIDEGFSAIGRPNCTGGVRQLVMFLQYRKPRSIVVVSDNDEPGQLGAHKLARTILPYCTSVRIIRPRAPHKDLRSWLNAGADRSDMERAIAMAQIIEL